MPRAGLDPARVVETAAAIADRQGLAAVSLGAVAEKLGVRPPSLYNHVEGLDGLLRLLAHDGARGLGEALAEAALGRSGRDAVQAMAQAYRAYAHAHPGRYQASLAAPARGDKVGQAVAARVFDVVLAALSAFALDGEDAVHAARGMRAALHGFVSLEAAGGFGMPADRDESFARLVDTVVAGLEAARRRARRIG